MTKPIKCQRCGKEHANFREEAACITQDHPTREESDVVWDRVADRLDGYSHEEVVKRHPAPPGSKLPSS